MSSPLPLLSIVVPVYNEANGINAFHRSLLKVLQPFDTYEIVYVDDGSTDGSLQKLQAISKTPHAHLVRLSRNFGKEIATTAGLHAAHGQAIMMLDSDGQHPVELIPEFVKKWQAGAKVVIGLRTANQNEGLVKRWGSKLFYKLINTYSGFTMVPNTTDFRLIDREVQQAFNTMTERNRVTRGLIDWLGYERVYVPFKARARETDAPSYSFKKLFKLAIDTVISLSLSPLYISAWIGAVMLPLSFIIGAGMGIDVLLNDPLNLHLTGAAFALMLVLFLIGVLLVSQGIIGLYLSHIHTETKNRPLYVIDEVASR